MNVTNVSLAAVAVKPEQYPTDGKCEFAFIGKSNVGKSSLINAMINRKSLARTSQNPGKTRTINFYDVEDMLYFVDLPGYGYAKISRSESQKWGKMIETYLKKREQLRKIIFLIDIRHEPSANDKMMFEWLNFFNFSTIIVATKSDKLKRSQINKNLSTIRKGLQASADTPLIPFSSATFDGKDRLWGLIDSEYQTTD